MKPLVYVIVLNYKGLQDTIDCVESLSRVSYGNHRLVIVDNASGDGSYEALKERYPMHAVLQAGENRGFSAGNNLGIQHALEDGAEYIVLLNNDTTVEPDFLEHLVEGFQTGTDVGITGGMILYHEAPMLISHAGGHVDRFRFTVGHHGLDQPVDTPEFNVAREVEFVSGCLMMVSRQLIETVGLLDEDYFMYYEDADYCLKARAAGFRLVYQPKARIRHKVSQASGGPESPFYLYWNTRNRKVFMERYLGSDRRMAARSFYYGTRAIRLLKYLAGGHLEQAKAIARGIRDGRRKARI